MAQKPLSAINPGLITLILINILLLRTVNAQTCDPNCQQGIDDNYNLINNLQTTLSQADTDIIARVQALENGGGGGGGGGGDQTAAINDLTNRVTTLEQNLAQSVTDLGNRITNEIAASAQTAQDALNTVNTNLDARVTALEQAIGSSPPTGGGGGSGSASDVYLNLTRRIDALEYTKVFNLTQDNQVWRRNFRVINATFNKIRKSNNCICR